jgi:glycosyltransferase involved in cell wall biosynthesis
VLAARGHDVTWWTATWSHRRKAPRTAPLGLREDEGFSVRLVAVRPYEKNVSLARLASHRAFGRTFERLANESVSTGQLERPDLIIASLPPLEGPEAALRLARRLDATFVLDVQDLWPETFERLLPGPPFLKRLLAPLLLGGMRARREALVAAADAVSATTHTYADVVLRGVGESKPRHVCTVGAYPQEFPDDPRSVNRVPLPGGAADVAPALECVYAGSLEASQDLEIIPAAARLLAGEGVRATIHVAGTGSREAALARAAEGGEGSCRVQLHGLLDRAGYVSLLSRCDVGLVCVKPESLVAIPNKAGDFAAAGLAIVSSLPGELESLIEENDAGVRYTAGDPVSLARAIAALASDPRRLAACRAGARRLAAAAFDRERTYQRFADWLETLPD